MSLKKQFFNWQLNRKQKELNRNVQVVNLNQARSIGIVWKIDDREVFNSLVKQLKKREIEVQSICFSSQRGSVQGEAVFSPDDFSVFGKVKNETIASFINQKFDILMDISLSSGVEIQYIRALSQAKFKVGWSDAKLNFFDLSIDVHNRKEPSYLAEQLVHYLTEINKQVIHSN